MLNTAPVADELKFVSIYEQIEKATSGTVQATELSPFNQSKVSSVEDICAKIKELCAKEKQQFILAYWPEPDATMHKTGTSSDETKSVLDNINKTAEKLSSELKDTLLIITADHGHVDLDEEIYINEYPELEKMLLHPLSFEDRVVSVFVKPEFKNEFPQLLNKLFPDEFAVFDKETVLKKQLFGTGKIHPRALDFIGDFIVASVGNKSLRQYIAGTPKMPVLRGSHAGLCADEMRVPLILVEKDK
jgi:predicted AlkP superfamily pyrophosphatase or phosphodiesterase